MRNTKVTALLKLTEEEMASAAGGMSCEKATAIAKFYVALSTVQKSVGDTEGSDSSLNQASGLLEGACSP